MTLSHLIIKDSESSKCLLKILFIESLQEKISVIENIKDSVIEINIIDYAFINAESETSAKCKRTEESYKYQPEIENIDSTIN
ncbi:7457_t:CDS:2 [Cetraspora pellucida]|uniref:7457_t:CDS:1 n=1 Tax=Cetraspora pellucida TaxID=1433469 RepID=A0A9N9AG63_9GLOM|nr:7457_t:CDS:2 [Cetraspora pellucida]